MCPDEDRAIEAVLPFTLVTRCQRSATIAPERSVDRKLPGASEARAYLVLFRLRAPPLATPLRVLLAGMGLGAAVDIVIGLATGSAGVGLHGAFWNAVAFTLLIESRIGE
jgi:hypothetical protein